MHNLGQKWPKFDIFAPRVCDTSLERIFYVDSNKINEKLIIYNSLPHFTRFYGYIQLVFYNLEIQGELIEAIGDREVGSVNPNQ